ncbi:hypothetical protein CYMTET_34825 [Cymbomonas tetramitiformis]|uniref:Uncharacterized protein n=1 Tax=Cymbomonas tetramitiformis TaxID=36881 RepID=A0AAE0KPT0_9CHLO|nr:hypothetical protein CYMTET_34825 [Cymbomonas tetramitiformis]
MASRRRSLATIFDSAVVRNSVTPATPAPAGVPAANSAQAVFLAGVRSLTRERFDESVAKHVIRKCFREKHDRFTGTESNAQVLLSKLVPALEEAFEAERALFAPMFDLEDSSLAVRPEANKLLFSTLELIVLSRTYARSVHTKHESLALLLNSLIYCQHSYHTSSVLHILSYVTAQSTSYSDHTKVQNF